MRMSDPPATTAMQDARRQRLNFSITWKAGKEVLFWDLSTENTTGKEAKPLLDSPAAAVRT